MLAQGMGLNQVTALAKALNQETEYAGDRLMGKKKREKGIMLELQIVLRGQEVWQSYVVGLNPGSCISTGIKQQLDNFSKNGIPLGEVALHSSFPPPQHDMEREQNLSGSALHFVGCRLENEWARLLLIISTQVLFVALYMEMESMFK